jgi:heat shock protein HslJ
MRHETVLAGLVLLILAACDKPPVAGQAGVTDSVETGPGMAPGGLPRSASGQVRGTPWRLEDLDKTGIIDRSRITLLLGEDGRAVGMAGCNRYTTGYLLDGKTLTIDPRIASTRMACMTDSLMYQEQRFFELLPLMHKAEIDETGALILGGKDGASMKFYMDEDAGRAP